MSWIFFWSTLLGVETGRIYPKDQQSIIGPSPKTGGYISYTERKSWRCCDTLCLVRSWSCFSRCANHSNGLVSKEEEETYGESLEGEILNNFWTIFHHHSHPYHRAPGSYLNHSHPDSWWRISHFYYQPARCSLVDISFYQFLSYPHSIPWNPHEIPTKLPLKSPLKTSPLISGWSHLLQPGDAGASCGPAHGRCGPSTYRGAEASERTFLSSG